MAGAREGGFCVTGTRDDDLSHRLPERCISALDDVFACCAPLP